MIAVRCQLQHFEECGKLVIAHARCGESHVLLDRAPGEQPRFLEYHAEPACGGQSDSALKVVIEPRNDP
jgi:hypothetical protein